MCGFSTVQYSCGCEVAKQIRPCSRETGTIHGKEMEIFCALVCRAEGLQGWCGSQNHKIGCTKLCADCSIEKRRAMREAIPGTIEWENRRNWSWWRDWKADPKIIAEREAERMRRRYKFIIGEPVGDYTGVSQPYSPVGGHVSTESYELGNRLMRFHRWSGVPGGGWWAEVGESGGGGDDENGGW